MEFKNGFCIESFIFLDVLVSLASGGWTEDEVNNELRLKDENCFHMYQEHRIRILLGKNCAFFFFLSSLIPSYFVNYFLKVWVESMDDYLRSHPRKSNESYLRMPSSSECQQDEGIMSCQASGGVLWDLASCTIWALAWPTRTLFMIDTVKFTYASLETFSPTPMFSN